MSQIPRRIRRLAACAAAIPLFVIIAGAAFGQDPGTAPRLSQPLTRYTLDTLIPVRGEETLSAELDLARLWKRDAEALLSQSREQEAHATSNIDIKKHEIEILELRSKEAKRQTDKERRAKLEETIRQQKQEVGTLEAIRDLSREQAGYAEAWVDAAAAFEKSIEAEREVLRWRAGRVPAAGQTETPLDETGWRAYDRLHSASEERTRSIHRLAEAMNDLDAKRGVVLRLWKPATGR